MRFELSISKPFNPTNPHHSLLRIIFNLYFPVGQSLYDGRRPYHLALCKTHTIDQCQMTCGFTLHNAMSIINWIIIEIGMEMVELWNKLYGIGFGQYTMTLYIYIAIYTHRLIFNTVKERWHMVSTHHESLLYVLGRAAFN